MNKIYKVVWSSAKNCYVVVSEYAKRQTKSAQTKKIFAALMAAGIMASGAGMASADGSTVSVDVLTGTKEITGLNQKALTVDGEEYTIPVYHNSLGALVSSDSLGASSAGSIALGKGSSIAQSSDNSIAIGTNAGASGENATAVGSGAGAAAKGSAAFGDGADATNSSTAIGGVGTNAHNHSIAIGSYDEVEEDVIDETTGEPVIDEETGETKKVKRSLGTTSAEGQYSVAIGLGTSAGKIDAVAIGRYAGVTAEQGVAIGYNAKVSGEVGSVALGANSITDEGRLGNNQNYFAGYTPQQDWSGHLYGSAGEGAYEFSNTIYKPVLVYDADNPVWKATDGAVSVGAAASNGKHNISSSTDGHEITRQITHVAAGSELTDAVNVAQLLKMQEYIDESNKKAGKTDFSLIANPDAENGEYTVGSDGKVSLTVKDGSSLNQGSYQVTIGGITSKAYVDAQDDFAVKYDSTTDTEGNKVADKTHITLNPGADYTVTKNEDGTTTVTGGSTITNLRPGALSETSTDAVNGSQLYATNQNVTTNTTNITELKGQVINGGTIGTDGKITLNTAGNNTIDLTGKVSDYSVTSGSIAKGADGKNVLTLVETNAFGGDSKSVTINGIASESDVAAAKTVVKAGTNVTVTDTTAADGHTEYTISATDTTLKGASKDGNTVTIEDTAGNKVTFTDSDTKYTSSDSITINNDNSVHINEGGVNIAYTANSGDKKKVSLANGLNFVQGGATTVTAGENGEITISSTDTNNYVTSGSVTTEGEGDSKKTYITLNREGLSDVKIDVSGLDTGSGASGRWTLKTFKNADDTTGTTATINSDDTVSMTGENGVEVTSTAGENGGSSVKIGLGNEITLGEKGEAGQNGKDGAITIIHQNTETKITLSGKDGKDGATGKDGITRIVYQDKDGEKQHEVATLDDGLTFAGDTGTASTVKLNNTVTISGGIKDTTKLSDKDNIGVVSDGKGNLSVKLAKDISGVDKIVVGEKGKDGAEGQPGTPGKDGSITIIKNNTEHEVLTDADDRYLQKGTDTLAIDTEGKVTKTGYKVKEDGTVDLVVNTKDGDATKATTVTIGDIASKSALDELDDLAVKYDSKAKTSITLGNTYNSSDHTGGTVIKNVAYATGNDGSEAVNVDYLKNYVTDNGGGSWKLTTNNGTAETVGKGDTVDISGKDESIVVTNDGKNVKIGLGNEIKVGKDGKDGAAGSIGLAGKDGKDGISTTTIRTEYVKVDGKDGKDGEKGIPGLDGEKGADGVTRIVYKDPDGSDHKVATLDDGLYFKGDVGASIGKKLNTELSITGGATEYVAANNIAVVNDNGALSLKLAKDITGINSIKITGEITNNSDETTVVNKKYVDNLFTKTDGNHTAITVNGESAPADGSYTSGNLQLKKTTTDGKDTYDVKLADDITLGDNGSDEFVTISGSKGTIWASHSIAAGNVIMDGDSGMISGLSNTTTKYQGFADGSGKAATEEQLKEAMDQAKADAAAADTHVKAGEYSVDKDGKVSMDIVDKDGNSKGTVTITDVAKASDVGDVTKIKEDLQNKDGTKTTVVDAVNNLDTKVNNIDNRVTKIEETAGKHSSVSTEDANLSIDDKSKNAAGGTDYKISLAKDLKVDSVTAGEKTKIDKDGVSYDGKNYIGKDGLNANSQKITNVADGDVKEGSKDAVNGGQLYETNQNVTNNTIAINNISGSVNKLSNRINRVGAGAAALAALHPLDFDPDAKWDFAAGYGNYRGANAAAVGAYYRPNEDLMFSVGASMGGGENMVNAGVSVKLGSGSSHVSTSRVAMAKEIQALREHVAQQDKLIAKMAQGDAISERDLQSTMQNLFPDVPENHWAYDYVEKLGKAGLVEGYPDGEYKGDRMLTRYEFAAVIYRAMQLGVSRIPELSEDGTLSKLVNEFGPELKYIRVDTVKTDKNGDPEIQRVRTVKENLHK